MVLKDFKYCHRCKQAFNAPAKTCPQCGSAERVTDWRALTSNPLPGVLIYSVILLSVAFYAIRRLFLELSLPTIAALNFVGILAALGLLVWVLGVLNEFGRKE